MFAIITKALVLLFLINNLVSSEWELQWRDDFNILDDYRWEIITKEGIINIVINDKGLNLLNFENFHINSEDGGVQFVRKNVKILDGLLSLNACIETNNGISVYKGSEIITSFDSWEEGMKN